MKTEIDEAIRETLVVENKQSIGIAVDKISALFASQDKWISVEEQLPDYNKQVLVMYYPPTPTMDGQMIYGIDKRYELPQSQLPNGIKERLIDNKNFMNAVKFWQPLPPPPKTK